MVVKPSELAPACSSFLARIVPLYLDNKAIKVVEGGSDVAEKLLEQKWEKIFFTGILLSVNSISTFRILMKTEVHLKHVISLNHNPASSNCSTFLPLLHISMSCG